MKVALIQLNSRNDKQKNLRTAKQFIVEAINNEKPELIALPEMFVSLGGSLEEKKQAAESFDSPNKENHPAFSLMEELAKQHRVYIHAGSMIEYSNQQYFNTTLVFDPEGRNIIRYRKMNLFQTALPNGVNYDETKFFTAGKDITTYPINDVIVGCAICYDLRFCQVFNNLVKQHVKIIVIPSAFTYATGQAHWELLCRTRAIETQSFLIAPAQTGTYSESGVQKKSWGHSMIVDPWGNVLINAEEKTGYFTTTLDFDFLQDVRNRLPVLKKILNVSPQA